MPCSSRPGGMAHHAETESARQYHIDVPAGARQKRWETSGSLCDEWLSNRIFKDYDDIVTRCCDAWNKLVDQPWKIM